MKISAPHVLSGCTVLLAAVAAALGVASLTTGLWLHWEALSEAELTVLFKKSKGKFINVTQLKELEDLDWGVMDEGPFHSGSLWDEAVRASVISGVVLAWIALAMVLLAVVLPKFRPLFSLVAFLHALTAGTCAVGLALTIAEADQGHHFMRATFGVGFKLNLATCILAFVLVCVDAINGALVNFDDTPFDGVDKIFGSSYPDNKASKDHKHASVGGDDGAGERDPFLTVGTM